MKNKLQSVFILCTVSCSGCRNHFNWQNVCIYSLIFIGILIVWTLFLFFRSIVEEAMQCKKKILQNDGIVTSSCARPRKAGHTLLILGGQTFMCDKIYQVTDTVLNTWMTCFLVWQNIVGRDVLKKVLGGGQGLKIKKRLSTYSQILYSHHREKRVWIYAYAPSLGGIVKFHPKVKLPPPILRHTLVEDPGWSLVNQSLYHN